MKPAKINPSELNNITKKIIEKSDEAIGLFVYNGFRIQVSKYKMDGGSRVRILYNKRRAKGLCIICVSKVTKINPITGKLYRLCETHRTSIDKERGRKKG
ncbi:MAG TPA: hypothetical protein PK079_22510 [Leptospiraceae bacterium]|nr:hypothetical protein [Leptospiraceae bacterium]HMW07281.1 hypothetical protein [Leptospiraceae bacterium]HMX33720.1 hypothetical protein [Leptospiraceae bacterium]HMY32901.1 hypothetical protein [Leptospiraceae bacterium]HMZ66637.1 hypothetical protein [Leptospiraceae bacterium]